MSDTNIPASVIKLHDNRELMRLASLVGTDAKTPELKLARYIDKLLASSNQAARESVEYWQAYDGLYDVSVLGRVRRDGKIIKQSDNGNGYRVVSISNSNVHRNQLVHRLVAITFLPNPDKKPCVNHKDGDKANNIVSNLEWATYSENERHSYDKLGKVNSNKGNLASHCKYGHEMTPENSGLRPKRGTRYCIACNRRHSAEQIKARKLQAESEHINRGRGFTHFDGDNCKAEREGGKSHS